MQTYDNKHDYYVCDEDINLFKFKDIEFTIKVLCFIKKWFIFKNSIFWILAKIQWNIFASQEELERDCLMN